MSCPARLAIAALAALLAIGSAAQAQLSYDEVVAHMPGAWEIDPTWTGQAQVPHYRPDTFKCDKYPAMVRIDRTAEGDFYSAERADGDVVVNRAPLVRLPNAAGLGIDGVTSAAATRVFSIFVMPDPDHLGLEELTSPLLPGRAPTIDGKLLYPMLRRCGDAAVA
jgi:hypothetical protein